MTENPTEQQAQGMTPSGIDAPSELTKVGIPPAAEAVDERLSAVQHVELRGPDSLTPALLPFSQDVHKYLREFIQLADRKATFFFAAATALLAYLSSEGLVDLWLSDPRNWSVAEVLAFVACATLATCVALTVSVVLPRTPGSRRGMIFWEAIRQYSTAKEYADEVASTPAPDLSKTWTEHCYDLAGVCSDKYRVLRRAIVAGTIGVAASILLMLLQ